MGSGVLRNVNRYDGKEQVIWHDVNLEHVVNQLDHKHSVSHSDRVDWYDSEIGAGQNHDCRM